MMGKMKNFLNRLIILSSCCRTRGLYPEHSYQGLYSGQKARAINKQLKWGKTSGTIMIEFTAEYQQAFNQLEEPSKKQVSNKGRAPKNDFLLAQPGGILGIYSSPGIIIIIIITTTTNIRLADSMLSLAFPVLKCVVSSHLHRNSLHILSTKNNPQTNQFFDCAVQLSKGHLF